VPTGSDPVLVDGETHLLGLSTKRRARASWRFRHFPGDSGQV